jgi:hypothetical protein
MVPSADAWARLEQEFLMLDDDANPALIASAQRYKQHQPKLEECYDDGQYMPLERSNQSQNLCRVRMARGLKT